MDKDHKFHAITYVLTGNTVATSKSTERWSQKRKHLSTAFYKENISQMIRVGTKICNEKVKSWYQRVDKGENRIILNKEIQLLIDDII